MVFQKKFYLSFMAAGTVTLLFAFNNCSSRDAGTAVQSAADLASSGCKVENEVLVQQVKDGDYHIHIFAPENEAGHFNEKLYLNNQSNPDRAPRWKNSVINWYYNPTGAPSGIAATALSTIQESLAYWSSVCKITFNYLGTTTKAATSSTKDNTSVIGWGNADGATGITYSYMSGSSYPLAITEADVNFSSSQVRDTKTLTGVANHEVGHMLGLAHSDVSESIMYANPYHSIQYLLMLRPDDVAGCVDLYGAASVETATPTPTPNAMPTPRLTPTPVPTIPSSPSQGY